jgi:hypothetical protein
MSPFRLPQNFRGFVVDDVYHEISHEGTHLIPTDEKPGFAQLQVEDVLTMANCMLSTFILGPSFSFSRWKALC